MASLLARQLVARRALTSRSFTTTTRRLAGEDALKSESKRNPELIVLGTVMAVTFIGAGFYFGRSPTSSTSEQDVHVKGMPWEAGSATDGKYQYHPGGDPSREAKDAPSAVNVVIVPNVNLPKELHDKYNKWGKDGY